MNTQKPRVEFAEFYKGLQEMDPAIHTCNELQTFISGMMLYIKSRTAEIENANALITGLEAAVQAINPAKEYHTDEEAHKKIFASTKERILNLIMQR